MKIPGYQVIHTTMNGVQYVLECITESTKKQMEILGKLGVDTNAWLQ